MPYSYTSKRVLCSLNAENESYRDTAMHYPHLAMWANTGHMFNLCYSLQVMYTNDLVSFPLMQHIQCMYLKSEELVDVLCLPHSGALGLRQEYFEHVSRSVILPAQLSTHISVCQPRSTLLSVKMALLASVLRVMMIWNRQCGTAAVWPPIAVVLVKSQDAGITACRGAAFIYA